MLEAGLNFQAATLVGCSSKASACGHQKPIVNVEKIFILRYDAERCFVIDLTIILKAWMPYPNKVNLKDFFTLVIRHPIPIDYKKFYAQGTQN